MHGITYVLISVCFNVFGQYSMKQGMRKFGEVTFDNNILITVTKMFLLPNVLLGLLLYGVSTVFWLIALSKIELSVAYPMLSMGYILLMILSYFLLNESVTLYKIIGTLLIVAGVTLISR
ncbi:MAG: EamA family transporter [Calditrichia bacterium]|nr:EamA family transporter [Calditrichia bacterium]